MHRVCLICVKNQPNENPVFELAGLTHENRVWQQRKRDFFLHCDLMFLDSIFSGQHPAAKPI